MPSRPPAKPSFLPLSIQLILCFPFRPLFASPLPPPLPLSFSLLLTLSHSLISSPLSLLLVAGRPTPSLPSYQAPPHIRRPSCCRHYLDTSRLSVLLPPELLWSRRRSSGISDWIPFGSFLYLPLHLDRCPIPAPIMWLYRGAQSAVFYYATCTPCANSIDRRKRMKDAARSKREQARLEAVVTDQPRPFPQPTAFSTNQGWMEEIALGPGPPARRHGHRSTHRRTESWNTDAVSSASCQDRDRKGGRKDKSSLMQPLEDRWNRMRYQREDEPLWGEEMEVKGSSVGLSGRGRADASEPSKYYIARVPPVNDLHPPIVSGPKSRAETRWMLQPPPSAKVMAGKERFSTSANSSYGTRPADRTRLGPKSPSERTHQLPPLSTQSPELQTSKSSLTPVSPPDLRSSKTPGAETNISLPAQPSPTAHPYSRDESRLVITTPIHSPSVSSASSSPSDSEIESPRISLRSPDTPVSRPTSKGIDDSTKHIRPSISKTLSTLQRDTKKIHMLQLEINESPDDVALGEFERLRPWRWSMDI